MMMALRKQFQEQYNLYGVKAAEENKNMNLGITHIFDELSIETANKLQVDNENGEPKKVEQRSKSAAQKKQATFDDSRSLMSKLKRHFKTRIKGAFGLDDRIFDFLQIEDKVKTDYQKQEDLEKDLNQIERLWGLQVDEVRLQIKDMRRRDKELAELEASWKQQQIDFKRKHDDFVKKEKDTRNLDFQRHRAEESYFQQKEEIERSKRVPISLKDGTQASLNQSMKQSEASKSKQAEQASLKVGNSLTRKSQFAKEKQDSEVHPKEPSLLKFKVKEDNIMAKVENILADLERDKMVCFDKIKNIKDNPNKMFGGAIACNKFQLLNFVYDKINPKESVDIKHSTNQNEKQREETNVSSFDFANFEPKAEEKKQMHSFYKTVFKDSDVAMKDFNWDDQKTQKLKEDEEEKNKKKNKKAKKEDKPKTYPMCMSHFTYKEYLKEQNGQTDFTNFKEEQLVIFALVSKEIVINKVKQTGTKHIFVPICNHKIADMPILMDVSQHKVKNTLIVCLATSGLREKEIEAKKENKPKENKNEKKEEQSHTQTNPFKTIILEFIKIKDSDDYRVEKIFEQESPFPQITSILYRPQCGLIMSCFRGYIEIFDSIKFESTFKWDRNIKKNVIQNQTKIKGNQSEIQKLNVQKKIDLIYSDDFGAGWNTKDKVDEENDLAKKFLLKYDKTYQKKNVDQNKDKQKVQFEVQKPSVKRGQHKKSIVTIDCLDFSAALDLIAFGGVQGKIGVIDTTTMNFQDLYETNMREITALYFYDKELQMLTLSLIGEVCIWDAQKMVVIQVVKNKKAAGMLASNISTTTFYPDQGILLLATTKIYVWEMKEEADARIQIEQQQTVAQDFLQQYKKQLQTCGVIQEQPEIIEKVESIQEVESGKSRPQTSSSVLHGLSLETQNQLIGNIFQVQNLAQNTVMPDPKTLRSKKMMDGKVLSFPESRLVGCFFNAEFCQIITIDIDCLIRIWCLRKGVCIKSYPLELPKCVDATDEEFKNRLKIQSAAISECFKILVVSFEGGLIQLNNVYSGATLYNKNVHKTIDLGLEVADLSFFNSQCNFWVAAACWGGKVAFLKKPLGTNSVHENISYNLSSSDHSRDVTTIDTTKTNHIVSGSIDNVICFWNSFSGEQTKSVKIPKALIEKTMFTNRSTLKIGAQENYIQQLKYACIDSHEFVMVFMSLGDVFILETQSQNFVKPDSFYNQCEERDMHKMAFAKVPTNSIVDRKQMKITQFELKLESATSRDKSGGLRKLCLVLAVSENGEGTIHKLKVPDISQRMNGSKSVQMDKLHSFWVEKDASGSYAQRLKPSKSVFSVSLQPEYGLFVVGQSDGTVTIFDIANCKRISMLNQTSAWDTSFFRNLNQGYRKNYEQAETYAFGHPKPQPPAAKRVSNLNRSVTLKKRTQILPDLSHSEFNKKKPSIQTENLEVFSEIISPSAALFKQQLLDFKQNHNLLTSKNARNNPINFSDTDTRLQTKHNSDADQTLISTLFSSQRK